MPYVMKELNCPVYGCPLTLGILSGRLRENGVSDQKCKAVKAGATVRAGSFRVEFIHVNHSIPDAVSLAIHTPVGTIVHTGDYKFDQTLLTASLRTLHGLPKLEIKASCFCWLIQQILNGLDLRPVKRM